MTESATVPDETSFTPPDKELLTLESEALRVSMWPRMGGKITSLVVRGHGALAGNQDRELLHPPIHPYNTPTVNSAFERSDAGGWDECFPTVAACSINGTTLADHGDIWRRPWDTVVRNEAILAHVNATSKPLRFSRWLSLDGPTMHLRYSVTNTGSRGADFIWSAHPLLQVEEGDRIVLPESVVKVHVEASAPHRLAEPGATCPWPLAVLPSGRHLDLSTIGPRDGVTSCKLFAGPLKLGWCGLYRAQLNLGIVMRFDPGQTPFAGLWISQGAWPPGGGSHSQYTVALEPTMASSDSLQQAMNHGQSQHLLPQGEFSWPMQFEVFGSHTPVRYEEFLSLVNTAPRH